jgi:hypothetical protein
MDIFNIATSSARTILTLEFDHGTIDSGLFSSALLHTLLLVSQTPLAFSSSF